MLSDALIHICDMLYPPHCLMCHNPIEKKMGVPLTLMQPRFYKSPLCARCWAKISFNQPPFCVVCSRAMTAPVKNSRCKTCLYHKPYFDFAWGACVYTEPLKTLMHLYKYHQKTGLRFVFAQLIIDFIATYQLDIEQFDILVPIPLSSVKQRERGYNQSEWLAKSIAAHYRKPLITNILEKNQETQSQTRLTRKERWTNIKGTFTIKHPMRIKNQSILIIDDLLTTGATLSEAALALKQAGATTVGALTLAIVPANSRTH